MSARVHFILPRLGGGGAERTILNVVNHLDRDRFEPTLVLYRREGEYLPLVRGDVRILELGARRARHALVPLAKLLRRERPDALLSTLLHPNVVAVAAARVARYRGAVLVRESNHWSAAGRAKRGASAAAIRWAYRSADRVVCLSRGVAQDCQARYHLPDDLLRVAYNPIDLAHVRAAAGPRTSADGALHVLGCGRLVPQKGFDLLLQAVARLRDVRLTIVGEGPERRDLESLADRLGVAGRVAMPGHVDDPYPWFRRADVFVLSSRWEGFGHVIVEAMACGTPVLAARCPSGPDEIITDGVDGLLCEPDDPVALADGIGRLQDPTLRARLSREASASVVRFDAPTIAARYGEIIEECLT